MTSPTQRTLSLLRKYGYTSYIVEHWNQFARIRQDLFGGIDIVAIKVGQFGVLGIQTTSYSNMSKRVKKLTAIPALKLWVECGNGLEVWGWKKAGKSGKRKLWEVSKHTIDQSMFTI